MPQHIYIFFSCQSILHTYSTILPKYVKAMPSGKKDLSYANTLRNINNEELEITSRNTLQTSI